jgi:hypothetical protein
MMLSPDKGRPHVIHKFHKGLLASYLSLPSKDSLKQRKDFILFFWRELKDLSPYLLNLFRTKIH